jgi:hypothetical protein
MAKPYIPTLEIVIRRKFDGQIEGARSWVITGAWHQIDKLEDCISFVASAAMDSIPTLGKGTEQP